MIILVGTIHEDLQGPRRLHTILQHYKPQLVGLEASGDKEFEQKLKEETLAISQAYQHEIEYVFSKVRLELAGLSQRMFRNIKEIHDYELLVAEQYAAQSGASLIYLGDRDLRRERSHYFMTDYEKFMQKILQSLETEFNESNNLNRWRNLSPSELENVFNQQVRSSCDSAYGSPFKEEWEDLLLEDSIWAKKVREGENPNTLIMPVVGVFHIAEYKSKRYSTLYEWLKDLNPKRISLHPDADVIEAGIPFVLS